MSNVTEVSVAMRRIWQLPHGPTLDLRKREWIYFLAGADLIKIGRARALRWRLLGIQSQCPVPLTLLHYASAPAGSEAVLHELLDAHRVHGEWFMPEPVLALVSQLPRDYGPLTPRRVMMLAPGIDCRRHFLAAAVRKGANGRDETIKLSRIESFIKREARAQTAERERVEALHAHPPTGEDGWRPQRRRR